MASMLDRYNFSSKNCYRDGANSAYVDLQQRSAQTDRQCKDRRMISIRPNKWIVAIWGLSGFLGAVDLLLALKSPNGNFIHPNGQVLTAGSHVLLAVGFAILYSRRKPVPVAVPVAVAALTLRIWGAMVR
jgi:hypothetical protein